MSSGFIYIILAIVCAAILILLSKGQKQKKNSKRDITHYKDVTYQALPLLTKNEMIFWNILAEAVTGYYIFPQVATSALVRASSQNPSHKTTVRNKYERTRIDFIICDINFNIIAVVELDDKSHDNKQDNDAERDFILQQAGYKTFRFRNKNITSDIIRQQIFGS
jgi:Uncharacterized protein conserved in bacteria